MSVSSTAGEALVRGASALSTVVEMLVLACAAVLMVGIVAVSQVVRAVESAKEARSLRHGTRSATSLRSSARRANP